MDPPRLAAPLLSQAVSTNPTTHTEPAATRLIILARDLDTDERSQMSTPTVPPAEPAEQREQMQQIVGTRHPSARIRSFAEGAATFLDRQHLLVVYYEDRPRTRRHLPAGAGQDRLFAA